MQSIREERPDAIIVATGGNPIMLNLPGIEGKNVCVASAVLDGKVSVGRDVVIIGGGTVGCEVALHVAKQGAMRPDIACFLLKHKVLNDREVVEYTTKGNRNITILEMKRKIGGGFGISTRWVILNELKSAGVNEIVEVKVKEIVNNSSGNGQRNGGVIYEKDGQEHFIRADTIIVAVGYSPNDELRKQIEGKFAESYFIGDCVKVRTALEAIHEGFEVALKI